MKITQYMRHDGRANEVIAMTDDATDEMAKKLEKMGFRFECEVLTTNEVSLSCSFNNKDGEEMTAGIEIAPDKNSAIASLQKLVENVFKKVVEV